jgi:hypothetical protein
MKSDKGDAQAPQVITLLRDNIRNTEDSYGTLKGESTPRQERVYLESREIDTSYKQTMSRGYGKRHGSIQPLGRRNLAPDTIGKDRMPNLSPIGSLTNLLTDISTNPKTSELYRGSTSG